LAEYDDVILSPLAEYDGGSKTRMTFSTHKQKFASKKAVVWGYNASNLCAMCFAAQIRFCCESD